MTGRQDQQPERQELELEPEEIRDLDVDDEPAEALRGGSGACAGYTPHCTSQ